MDIDKPLDDMIQATRKPRGSGGGGADRKPRPNRERRERDSAPYARPPARSTEDKWVHDAYEGPARGERGERRGGRRERDAAPVYVSASPRIEVSGVHYEVTTDELKDIFSQAGTIVQGPTIRYDRSGRSTGIAVVEYASAQQAKVAINKFDGAMTKGQTIAIKLIAPARAKEDKAASGSGSLLNRLGGGSDLAGRIGRGDRERAPRGGRGDRDRGDRDRGDRDGARERGDREHGERGERRGGRGGASRGGRGGNTGAPRGGKRGPANADDLDKELDGFMKPDAAGDVAMA
ncbi:uncharacterized protein EHS24_004672 [Apiotrichum porosum]|uniref:RRM domain-containing protein n=1 Tax=Apiotrichum porosum TaxID=105984 RepID=A0A427Y5S3_9TREE|nr:uncharacterized protein EHS24_004672 [Apiotrichum porosum]RSH86420.1 hypothetical protein EHS24_004672 [Apiotrichum porosum]